MDIYRTYVVQGPASVLMIVVMPARGTTKIKDLRWEVQIWSWGKITPFYDHSIFSQTFEKGLVAAEKKIADLTQGVCTPTLKQSSIDALRRR